MKFKTTNSKSQKSTPTWCPGCGTYNVNLALKQALKDLKIQNKNVVVSYDIGCGGNMINVLDVCGIETLHGRSIPVACGIKAVRSDLTVLAQAGDGGLLNEGLNHFIHAIQRNDPVTLFVNNNNVFGLTAGQQSSATPKGVQTRASRGKNKLEPLSIIDLAAVSGAGFIARVHEDNIVEIKEVFKKAIRFNGFAVVEIIQPCKIWAKDFPKKKYRFIGKPFSDRLKIIGQDSISGILYSSENGK